MSGLGLHLLLLDDAVRTRAFDRALAETVRPGAVVADLGAGSGILALLALKHGARRVYAVERGPAALLARILARENGVEDRLVIVRGRSQDVRLPERVDVVVSEMLGHAVFDEGLLDLFWDARRRFLKPGGRLIPSRVRVLAAPAAAPRQGRWNYGVKLEALRALARHSFYVPERVRLRAPARVLREVRVGRDRPPLELAGKWKTRNAGGVAVWFDADLSPSVRLNSLKGTHWRPAFFPAPAALRGRVELRLTFHSDADVAWRFEGYPAQSSTLADLKALAQVGLEERAVPRIPGDRAELVRLLGRVDGRRTVAQLARGLKGLSYAEALRRVKSLCLEEGLTW